MRLLTACGSHACRRLATERSLNRRASQRQRDVLISNTSCTLWCSLQPLLCMELEQIGHDVRPLPEWPDAGTGQPARGGQSDRWWGSAEVSIVGGLVPGTAHASPLFSAVPFPFAPLFRKLVQQHEQRKDRLVGVPA